ATPEGGPKPEQPGGGAAAGNSSVAGPAASIQALPPSERIDAIRGMVEGLERRLAKQGGTADEWLRLVRSHAVLGERDKALDALVRAREALKGDEAARARLDAQARELGLAEIRPGGMPGSAEASSDAKPTETGPSESRSSDAKPPGEAPRGGGMDSDAAANAIRTMPPAEREAAIRGMVATLDRRLAAKGGSTDEWMRLVRSYGVIGDRAAAIQALDRAKMALAANPVAVERLDALGRELDLVAKP
ncbi:hypothetical protein ACFQ4I_23920, partial [Methylorubrum suomiense]